MPRGAFNSTADFLDGPDTLTPGMLRFTDIVRFVAADGITWVDPGIPNVVGWITVDGSKPFGGWDAVRQLLIPGMGDTVAFPSGGAQQYWVVAVDEVLWRGQPLYYRAHIANTPRPVAAAPVYCKSAPQAFGNIITTNLPPGSAVLPGMRAYHLAIPGGYCQVVAVAFPFVTVSIPFGPTLVIVDMVFV